VESNGNVSIINTTNNADISFIIKDGGAVTTVMTIDGATSRVGIGTTTPSSTLEVSGTVNATAFTGPITGAITTTGVEVTDGGSIKFDGEIFHDSNATVLAAAEPTALNTITLPNRSGTVITTGDINGSASISGNMFKSKVTLSILDSSGATLTTLYAPGSNT
jgi:hypothetical protein